MSQSNDSTGRRSSLHPDGSSIAVIGVVVIQCCVLGKQLVRDTCTFGVARIGL